MQDEQENTDKPEELIQDNSDELTSVDETTDTDEADEQVSDALPDEEHDATEKTSDDVPGAKRKILLVEDDVALAAVYRSRLELEGFELFEVNDGEQALQAAKESQPDLILLDAMMPKISGFDVLDILRNTPETTNIKVIMLTALSQPKDKERAESLGVDDYLVKSQVVIGDVVERVKHHLNMS